MLSMSKSNLACRVFVFSNTSIVVYCLRMDYVDPDEPTMSDKDFIDDPPVDEDYDVQDGAVDSEADFAVERRSDEGVEYGSDDAGEEPAGVNEEYAGDDQVNCHNKSTALYPSEYSLIYIWYYISGIRRW